MSTQATETQALLEKMTENLRAAMPAAISQHFDPQKARVSVEEPERAAQGLLPIGLTVDAGVDFEVAGLEAPVLGLNSCPPGLLDAQVDWLAEISSEPAPMVIRDDDFMEALADPEVQETLRAAQALCEEESK